MVLRELGPATALSLRTTLSFCQTELRISSARFAGLRSLVLSKENRMQLPSRHSRQEIRGEPRDLRCAIRVPRSDRPTTATNHHRIFMEKPISLCHSLSRSGPRNRNLWLRSRTGLLSRLAVVAKGLRGAQWRTQIPRLRSGPDFAHLLTISGARRPYMGHPSLREKAHSRQPLSQRQSLAVQTIPRLRDDKERRGSLQGKGGC